jgi:hypothetical protein
MKFLDADVKYLEKLNPNPFNRKIDDAHKCRIKKQIRESPLTIPPIRVNVITNNIIDGHHRVEAFKELQREGMLGEKTTLPVMFVTLSCQEEMNSIISASANSKNWGTRDYVDVFSKVNPNYQTLLIWGKTHEICQSKRSGINYRMVCAFIKGKNGHILKKNDLKITDSEIKYADMLHDEIIELCHALGENPIDGKTGTLRGSHHIADMVLSWRVIRNQRPFTEWKKSARALRTTISNMPKNNIAHWNIIFDRINRHILSK